MKKVGLALVAGLGLLVNTYGQTPKPSPSPVPPAVTAPTSQPQENDNDDVVRITTKLVQVDVTVTDRSGNPVTTLTADDFEITENGRPQKINNFSYVSTGSNSPSPNATSSKDPSSAKTKTNIVSPPAPMSPLRPEQVQRAIALVVDDLRMSAEGISSTREALRKYVNQQMQPGDLIAIIRTSAGISSLQQFTNDRQQLLTAIDHVRQMARVGNRAGAFTSVNMLDRLETQVTEGFPDETDSVPGNQASVDRRKREGSISSASQPSMRDGSNRSEGINEFRDQVLTVGTLGALNFVVRGLRALPGRKAVVLFSDGISIFNTDLSSGEGNGRILSALRLLVDRANRASVVFYAIDTRGLQPTGYTAADGTNGGPAPPSGMVGNGPVTGVGSISTDLAGQQVFSTRSAEMFEGQNGLNYLAKQTGGLTVFNNNDLNGGIRRALSDISGYYLIGYRPDESTFDPATGRRRFNTWDIKLKNHPDLKVRSRGGFVGVADDTSRRANRTPMEQLMAALLSPFSESGIDLHLTSFFMNDDTSGSSMRSVLLFDANTLSFAQQPDGQFETTLHIIGVTLGDKGQIIDQVSRVEKIRVSPNMLKRFKQEGMVGGLYVPVAKPGAYLLRIAVRDEGSGRIGSVGQYIEVPNVNVKDRLALSSIVMSGNNPDGVSRRQTPDEVLKSAAARSPATAYSPATPTTQIFVAAGEGMVGTEDPLAGPASRRFRSKMFLNYACVVYAGKRDPSKMQLTSQVRLFHDGQEVFAGEPVPIDLSQQTDLKRLVVARRLLLGTVLEAGDYILHLTVTEASGSDRPRVATRWLDFRIVAQ